MAAKIKEKVVIVENPEQINPTNAEGFSQRGWAYYNLQEYELAKDDFLEALKENREDIDIQYALALTLKSMGKKNEAISHFEQLLGSLDKINDRNRASMIKKLTLGHIHRLTQGDWNLGVNE